MKAYLEPGFINRMAQLAHDEKRGMLADVVASPDGRSFADLSAVLRGLREGVAVPFSTVHKLVGDLEGADLVEVERRRGRGRSSTIKATDLGRDFYGGFNRLAEGIQAVADEAEVTRVVDSVPEHLIGSVISGLQQRLQPRTP